MAVKNIIRKVEQETGEQNQIQNLTTSISSSYEIVNENFTAEIGKNYAVDTTSGVVLVTLPTNPQAGEIIGFADAKGTWGTNFITIFRNGKNIEGSQVNFSNNASGTFFLLLFIDNSTGWRVLTSGTKPLNLTPPTVSGTYDFTSTNGIWTGNPTSFSYQWQMSTNGTSGWTNINGATSSTYLAVEADEGKYVRIGVVATNSNGPSVVIYSAASSAINIPDFPTTGLLAFWKLDNVNDSSGNANTLTNTNSVTFSAGKIGNSADFSGSNYLQTSASFSLTTHSISFWFKITDNAGVSLGVGTGYPGNFRVLTIGQNLYFQGPNANVAISSGVNCLDGQWHHCVAIATSNTLTIYLDNALNGTNSYSGSSNSTFKIGNAGDGALSSGGTFIDAVGLWNRALTVQEVSQLYNSGNGVEP